jgi:hypothetical protein
LQKSDSVYYFKLYDETIETLQSLEKGINEKISIRAFLDWRIRFLKTYTNNLFCDEINDLYKELEIVCNDIKEHQRLIQKYKYLIDLLSSKYEFEAKPE